VAASERAGINPGGSGQTQHALTLNPDHPMGAGH